MKKIKKILNYAIIAAVVTAMPSCLSDDSDNSENNYDDVAINNVVLGTMQRTYTTMSGENQTTVNGTYSGSAYKMLIDQINKTIYNVDSLPCGTKLNKVLLTITTGNNAVTMLKKNGLCYSISSTDTIDCSKEDTLRCFSANGEYYRDYTLNLRAHNEEGEAFHWNAPYTVPAIQALDSLKAMAVGSSIVVVGKKEGNVKFLTMDTANPSSWTVAATLDMNNMPQTVTNGEVVYALDTISSKLYTLQGSAPLVEANISSANVKTLLAAHKNSIYAVSKDGKVIVSNDNGERWDDEQMIGNGDLLPDSYVNAIIDSLKSNEKMFRIIAIGNAEKAADNTKAVVWGKLFDEQKNEQEAWIHHDSKYANRLFLPHLDNLSATVYDGKLIVIGGDYSKVYTSSDHGITWTAHSTIGIPAAFNSKCAAIVSTDNKSIWIICAGSGQVWRGHINRLAWKNVKQ